jgi:uncharacterized Tic20 family protein
MEGQLSRNFSPRNKQNRLQSEEEMLQSALMETPQLPPQDGPPPLDPAVRSETEHQWAIGIHLSALLGFAGPHLLNVVAPLIIWLIKKQDSSYLDAVGKRVLNFQISYSIYGFVAATLIGLLWWLVIGLFLVPLYVIIAVAWLLFTVIGAVKESKGEAYEYPYVIKFIP